MIETLTIITLSILFLIFFRPGKTPPLDKPLIIERPGQYRMTLAPQLNLAQPFIEAVAARIGAANEMEDSTTQLFEVRDKEVMAHGHDCFLLTITRRNGMLHFQAASPPSDGTDAHYRIAAITPAQVHDTTQDERIVTAILETARQRGVSVRRLFPETAVSFD